MNNGVYIIHFNSDSRFKLVLPEQFIYFFLVANPFSGKIRGVCASRFKVIDDKLAMACD